MVLNVAVVSGVSVEVDRAGTGGVAGRTRRHTRHTRHPSGTLGYYFFSYSGERDED